MYAFVRILLKIHWFLSTNIQLNLIAQNYVFWKRKSQNIWFWDVNLGNIFLSVLMRVLQINHKGKRIWCVNIINAQYITKHLATNAVMLNTKKRCQTESLLGSSHSVYCLLWVRYLMDSFFHMMVMINGNESIKEGEEWKNKKKHINSENSPFRDICRKD